MMGAIPASLVLGLDTFGDITVGADGRLRTPTSFATSLPRRSCPVFISE